jgi:hypothetical protein
MVSMPILLFLISTSFKRLLVFLPSWVVNFVINFFISLFILYFWLVSNGLLLSGVVTARALLLYVLTLLFGYCDWSLFNFCTCNDLVSFVASDL